MRFSSLLLVGFLCSGCGDTTESTIVAETTSDYSHIRVRATGSLRELLFVDAAGRESRQSAVDLDAPGALQLEYTRFGFASFLLKHPQERVLIVGLGGGAMLRFLNHHFPETHIDAVEIDPAVVALAAEHFGTREGPHTQIITEDAFAFLKRDHEPYDAIYMDAFLSPSEVTDEAGLVAAGTKRGFLRSLHRHLEPDGLVAFNLIESPETADDLAAIRESFPSVFVFDVPTRTNVAVIASRVQSPPPLEETARRLDAGLDLGFTFESLLGRLVDGVSSAR